MEKNKLTAKLSFGDFKLGLFCIVTVMFATCTGVPDSVPSRDLKTQEESGYIINNMDVYPQIDSSYLDSIENKAAELRYLYPDSSLALLDYVIQLRKSNNMLTGMGNSLMTKALTLVEKGKYQEAIATMRISYTFINTDNHRTKVAWHLNMAVIYSYTNEYQHQLLHYITALRELDMSGDNEDILYIPIYLNMSTFWSVIGDEDKRVYYMTKATQRASKVSLTTTTDFLKFDVLTSLYNALASNLIDKSRALDAIPYLEQSLRISDTIPSLIKRKKNTYLLLSMASLERGDYIQAESYVSLYQAAGDNTSEQSSIAMSNKILAEINFRRDNYERALFYASKATELFDRDSSKYHSWEIRVREIKAASLGKLGKNRESVNEYQTLMQVISRNLDAEKIKINQKMDFMYQTGLKDKNLAEQKLLIAQKNNQLQGQKILIILIISALIISVILLYAFRKRQQLQKNAFMLHAKEIEYKHLKEMSEMEENQRRKIGAELHDGCGGTLAAITMQLNRVKKEYSELASSSLFREAQRMVIKASDEIRNTAHNLLPEILLTNGLNEAIITYTDQIRQNSDLEIEYSCTVDTDEFNTEASLALFRIIQELLHNIIKHANATKVTIQLFEVNEKVNLIVEDNGEGFDVTMGSSGIGLSNIKTRVSVLGGGSIDIQSCIDKFTAVRIDFDKDKLV